MINLNSQEKALIVLVIGVLLCILSFRLPLIIIQFLLNSPLQSLFLFNVELLSSIFNFMFFALLVFGVILILIGARRILKPREKGMEWQHFGLMMFPTERIKTVAAVFGYVPAVIILLIGFMVAGTGAHYMESMPDLAKFVLLFGGIILAFGFVPLVGSRLIEKGKFERGGSINIAYSVMGMFLPSAIPRSGWEGAIAHELLSAIGAAAMFLFLTCFLTMVSGLLAMYARTVKHG